MDNFAAIISDYLDDELTPDQLRELIAWIGQSALNRQRFVGECYIHSELQDVFAGAVAVGDEMIALEQAFIPCPVLSGPSSDQPALPTSHLLPLLATAYHGTANFFSQDVPFACMMATLIVGFALVIASFITKEHYTQMPGLAASADRSYAAPESERADKARAVAKEQKEEVFHFVGRITGMVDCKWANPGRTFSSITDYSVALHDKYSLTSGLMEITYDTGAKVILQGPVTYEVESANGGYMSVGKLTGKVEVEKAKGFAVRTPTAIVTDLGTEFGVEVSSKEASTGISVFSGAVEVCKAIEFGQTDTPIRLTETESVQVTRQNDRKITVTRITTNPAKFARSEQLRQLMRAQQPTRVHTPPLSWPVLDKTFVAWVSLANLEQRGVGILSIVEMQPHARSEFDAIVFGELTPRKWMAGSTNFKRTEKPLEYPPENSKPDEFVQIAIVYDWLWVTIYRNGQKYAQFFVADRCTFSRDSILLIGSRYLDDANTSLPTLAGAVEEVRFYNVALSPKTIASLKLNEPSPIDPVGCWTFEDGTARDSTKNFPMGELHGKARIIDGKLILDGADSYLLVPPAANEEGKSNPTESPRQPAGAARQNNTLTEK